MCKLGNRQKVEKIITGKTCFLEKFYKMDKFQTRLTEEKNRREHKLPTQKPKGTSSIFT